MKDYNTWKIEEDNFYAKTCSKQQSIFTVGNGYLGMRGEFEEKYSGILKDCMIPGIYINGFYELGAIEYGERAYGFPEFSQTMLNVCNGRWIETYIDGQRFHLEEGRTISYYRELNMKKGIVSRHITWEAPNKKIVEIHITHMVSFVKKHIAAVTYSVKPVNFKGEIVIKTGIQTDIKRSAEEEDPRVAPKIEKPLLQEKMEFIDAFNQRVSFVKEKTVYSQLEIACAAIDQVDKVFHKNEIVNKDNLQTEYYITLEEAETVTVQRKMAYVTSNHFKENVEEAVLDFLEEVSTLGILELKEEQEKYLENFWMDSDIEIKGQPELTKAMRFNIYQLLQSVGRDGYSSICAKGLSGEGYGGHYFWESEIYILPVLLLSSPEIARKMLEFRYHILEQAKSQAKLLGHSKGALYAWRTINGEECSAYFPAGSAQYHISADIAWAIKRYIDVTGDAAFLIEYGAEILIETARLWIDTGHFDEGREHKFCIDAVTGPDEYTALVDNNCYTNTMARENLYNAVWAIEQMDRIEKDKWKILAQKIGYQEKEAEEFQKAADNMYLPYDKKLKLYKQDDTFMNKKRWNIEDIPKESRPLLIHFHPLHIYRHQICKQADLVLAEFLLSERFEPEQKRRDYKYYEAVTTHDSSLSASVFSIMACEIEEVDKAYEYFLMTAKTDLDDLQNNTKDGLHMANMAGTWACIIYGFGGLRIMNGMVHINPVLPKEWEGYRFRITIQGKKLEICVEESEVTYTLKEGDILEFYHKDEKVILKKEEAQNTRKSISR